MPATLKLTLTALSGEYSILRFNPSDEISPAILSYSGTRFISITRTHDELSIICPTVLLDEHSPQTEHQSHGWHCLRVEFSTEPTETPGIIAAVVKPLADASISVFAVASFDTDHVLVNQPDIAIAALKAAGHDINDQALEQ